MASTHIWPGFANVRLRFEHIATGKIRASELGVACQVVPYDLQATVERVAYLWGINTLGMLSHEWRFHSARAVGRHPGTEALSAAVVEVNAVGEVNQAPLPPNCALVVRKHTPITGKHWRGRMYLPGYALQFFTDSAGIINTGNLANINVNLANFLDDLVTSAGEETPAYLFHKNPAYEPENISELEAWGIIGTQRRRLQRNLV